MAYRSAGRAFVESYATAKRVKAGERALDQRDRGLDQDDDEAKRRTLLDQLDYQRSLRAEDFNRRMRSNDDQRAEESHQLRMDAQAAAPVAASPKVAEAPLPAVGPYANVQSNDPHALADDSPFPGVIFEREHSDAMQMEGYQQAFNRLDPGEKLRQIAVFGKREKENALNANRAYVQGLADQVESSTLSDAESKQMRERIATSPGTDDLVQIAEELDAATEGMLADVATKDSDAGFKAYTAGVQIDPGPGGDEARALRASLSDPRKTPQEKSVIAGQFTVETDRNVQAYMQQFMEQQVTPMLQQARDMPAPGPGSQNVAADFWRGGEPQGVPLQQPAPQAQAAPAAAAAAPMVKEDTIKGGFRKVFERSGGLRPPEGPERFRHDLDKLQKEAKAKGWSNEKLKEEEMALFEKQNPKVPYTQAGLKKALGAGA